MDIYIYILEYTCQYHFLTFTTKNETAPGSPKKQLTLMAFLHSPASWFAVVVSFAAAPFPAFLLASAAGFMPFSTCRYRTKKKRSV